MCWYSVDHSEKVLQAEAGQRLGIRKVHGRSWVVRESDLHEPKPTPVCLIDRTTVLFRSPEPPPVPGTEPAPQTAAPDSEAVFRMLKMPKRDVFQFADGREVAMDSLPTDLIFDVLEVPGQEKLSALLKEESEEIPTQETASARRLLLERVLQLF